MAQTVRVGLKGVAMFFCISLTLAHRVFVVKDQSVYTIANVLVERVIPQHGVSAETSVRPCISFSVKVAGRSILTDWESRKSCSDLLSDFEVLNIVMDRILRKHVEIANAGPALR